MRSRAPPVCAHAHRSHGRMQETSASVACTHASMTNTLDMMSLSLDEVLKQGDMCSRSTRRANACYASDQLASLSNRVRVLHHTKDCSARLASRCSRSGRVCVQDAHCGAGWDEVCHDRYTGCCRCSDMYMVRMGSHGKCIIHYLLLRDLPSMLFPALHQWSPGPSARALARAEGRATLRSAVLTYSTYSLNIHLMFNVPCRAWVIASI